MNLDDWVKEVTIEDIPSDYRDLATAIGVESLLRLASLIGGTTLYFPKVDYFLQVTRERMVINEYNGYNIRELAVKYNLSDVWVRKIVSQDLLKKSQLSLFDSAANQ